ncbi:SDR family oxidoreductase [Nocardia cyriacigeorgica]|uniref:SDR family oxidoreductase n=1 Tax=Nocardia cyriacigeorgica TaxID=135487 RepID=UPI001893A729|nr:SDR family oxidoreductase [Nocardia cyriacigeorgica]MBF6287809.1 SDR family oxidoreductase [Nocardia cyriacigeorgica]
MRGRTGRVRGKVAVVTGAANGTGRTHVRRLRAEGADVVAVDLPGSPFNALRADEPAGSRLLTAEADVRDVAALERAAETAVRAFGRVDILVANAGLCDAPGPTGDIDDGTWRRSLDINLTGTWNTLRAFGSRLSDGAAVVIVGSTSGMRGDPVRAHYSAVKHGMVGLARTVAAEWGQRGIRVNTVHPGAVGGRPLGPDAIARLCPDIERPTAADAEAVLARRNLIPVPWVDPVDVSNAVLFLASDESRYVTGTGLVVDAGFTQKG